MKIWRVALRNFRRLQDVEFTLETDNTLFVGPNNSGKTSATAAFRIFFKRTEFTISDFNVACIRALDEFGSDPNSLAKEVPKIELDIWLSIDPAQIEFGRAFSLIPNLGIEHDKVGMRLSFEADDAENMRADFIKTFTAVSNKTLTDYLSLGKNLSRYYHIQYYALQYEGDEIIPILIEPEEGRRVLSGLIRLDFIDAQRNIHDEDTGRHNRLSSAFAAYYKHNLEKPLENEEATKVIDQNNTNLTAHYDKHFSKLLEKVARLGVPSAHDRTLRLISSLSPQEALQGNTELYYEDVLSKHRLPEAYNGLGFKNLVYMAIQISHFHAQWMSTEVNRPLCQLIFIEEPEVHLHAQVQQVFIGNVYKILEETAKDTQEAYISPQLIISTHSSHVVDTVKFEKIRYFCRCPLKFEDSKPDAPLVASKVLNLQDFHAEPDQDIELASSVKTTTMLNIEDQLAQKNERKEESRLKNLNFLKKYVKLTHCDLFFADAALLVEGTVEKLLMKQMIQKSASELENRYITVLEVGGAYAHKFVSLMKFLGIPYVVITDIDTVDSSDTRKSCPAKTPGANTSNAALKFFFGTKEKDKIISISPNQQIIEGNNCFISFQRPIKTKLDDIDIELHGRTLEETFVYENLNLFRQKKISVGYEFAQGVDAEEIERETYNLIRLDSFKKTEFALGVAMSDDWVTPQYIVDGLAWLVKRLSPSVPSVSQTEIYEAAE